MSTRKHLAEQRRRRSQRNLIYAGLMAVLVLAGVLAITLSRSGSSTAATTTEVRPVTTTGSALPAFATSTSDPAIGMTIPTVTGTSFDGKPVSITNDGKAKVVLFVAHWCPHCQREVPLLAADLRQTPLPPNVEMITISTGVNAGAPNYPPSKWLAGVNWPTPVIADDSQSSAATAYGLTAYPYLVFVDAHNHVQFRSSGEMSLTEFHQHVAAIQK
jgi:cytochrome c biogenesis protein CcmG/thiol:disulfide interchange protein DsbE